MANPLKTSNVEILCKPMRKSLRILRANLCEKLTPATPTRAKLHFPTTLFTPKSQLYSQPSHPVPTQFFPLFHKHYYYYNFNKLIIK